MSNLPIGYETEDQYHDENAYILADDEKPSDENAYILADALNEQSNEPSDEQSDEINSTEENYTLIIRNDSDGTSITQKDDSDDNFIYIYPSQLNKVIELLQERQKLAFKHQDNESHKHEQARAYADQEVLKQEDNGKGNNDIYNKAYDYYLTQEPSDEQKQADKNISKICEGFKND